MSESERVSKALNEALTAAIKAGTLRFQKDKDRIAKDVQAIFDLASGGNEPITLQLPEMRRHQEEVTMRAAQDVVGEIVRRTRERVSLKLIEIEMRHLEAIAALEKRHAAELAFARAPNTIHLDVHGATSSAHPSRTTYKRDANGELVEAETRPIA